MPQPFDGTKTTDNEIKVTFDPSLSPAVTACERIVNVQCVRVTADGKAILAGQLDASMSFLDATTTPQLWTVDYLDGEKTPDYQQTSGTHGQKGVDSTPATMSDAPFIPNDLYKSYGGAFESVKLEFLNFTWCMKGNDCNKFYEGLSWTYTRAEDDVQSGSNGVANITSINDAAVPKELQDAFDKFNTVKKYVPCS